MSQACNKPVQPFNWPELNSWMASLSIDLPIPEAGELVMCFGGVAVE